MNLIKSVPAPTSLSLDDLDSILVVDKNVNPAAIASAKESAESMLKSRNMFANRDSLRDTKLDPDTQVDTRRRDATKHLITDRRDMADKVDQLKVGEYFTVGYKDVQSVRNLIYRHRTKYAPHKTFTTELFRYNQTRYIKVTRTK